MFYVCDLKDDIKMTGASFKCVPLHPPIKGETEVCSSSDWTINFQRLEETITPQTKMLIVNSPHNPTGKVYSRAELQHIGDLCVRYNIIIVSDEVYDRLDYTPFTHIATLSPEIERLTFTVGSVGKDFYCTGWRIGWVIGLAHLIDHVAVAHLRICYCTPNPLQEAAAVAYEQALINGFWPKTRADMRSKIDRFCEAFEELGIPYSNPQGGYFVLANMAKVRIPENYRFPAKLLDRGRDFHLAYFLIMKFGIASIPPSAFYSPENEHLGQDYLRFSVCKEDDVLEAAKTRLKGLKAYIRD
ncbi:Pyridoxal phosphate-dependent transferase, major region, subdomain 2 [Penicillium occitanis (nom. inval.)]|nr:Pyridoxal phosphate-dependent transferase, major region, subdomain 2 [Penicillium occitanis (nom. inval.)]PCG90231.1 hypothetical protein PENOC_103050 [Penicillium occitanis (nom. inval.)]